ncbi:hypothetical protein THASP1DRAFT_15061 [Thamnocephalis sphaerospora]|uniref:4-coumarate-CoA ligase n=1 Tax=Thamnocephalis sphaerospora TaxID=78915 RepID=A0A4P9XRX2_9FUNG|nr:hypothetical protein THASP1DRAFT_15061 [Thamnocephalis sphaerospora]|eukprot:RKP08854.1 hypothetical protein THASP1DRAFT_15061 [Thamnocephalis sphaerospora]
MVYKSHIPDIPIPTEDIYHYIFELPERQSQQDVEIFIDADTGRTTTVAQLRRNTRRFAGALQTKVGAKRGQIVAMCAPNSIDFPIATLGTLAAGLIVTTSNPAFHLDELTEQFKDSRPNYIVADYTALEKVKAAAAVIGIPDEHIFVIGAPDGRTTMPVFEGHTTLYGLLDGAPEDAPLVRLTPEEQAVTTAFICYSSGTTGKPKGVQITHRNTVANFCQYMAAERSWWDQLPTQDMLIGVLPFFHIYGLHVLIHVPILRRAPIVVMRRFQIPQFFELIQRYRVTFIFAVPPICLALAKHPLVEQYDMSSLREVICGAAPLGTEIAVAVRERLNVVVRQGLGMTEVSPLSHILSATEVVDGSSGQLLPNITAKVIDEEGNEVAPGEAGEMCVRGPNIMKGYLNKPEETAAMIDADGYLHTGDVVRVDENGHFFVVDRIKELIKYKGFQVAPAELEALIQTHDAVADAAVIQVQCPEQATELPKAYVALKATHQDTTTAQQIMDYVTERVAPYKKLRGGVEFIDVIPRSPSGKILRRLLRDREQAAAKAQ